MKLNLDQHIKGVNGENLQRVRLDENKKPKKEDMSLKHIISDALLGDPIPGDEKMTGKEKKDLWDLAEIIEPGGEVDLKIEEVALIKERIGKYYLPKVVGPTWKLLEG